MTDLRAEYRRLKYDFLLKAARYERERRDWQEAELNDAGAALDAFMERHLFGEREPRAMPVEDYCNALRTWAELVSKKHGYDSEYAQWLSRIMLDVSKSNLLARTIYGGEPLRTKECPQHKGRWSGIGACKHGCGETGWIPDDFPDANPRCTRHAEAPAVMSSFGRGGTKHMCWDCCVEEGWAHEPRPLPVIGTAPVPEHTEQT